MTIALAENLGSNAVGGTSGFNVPFNTTVFVPEGHRIVLGISWFANLGNNAVISAILGGSLPWVEDQFVISSLDAKLRTALYSAEAPLGGLAINTAITAYFDNDSYARSIAGVALSGVAATAYVDAVGSGQSASGTWSASITTVAAEAAIIGFGWVDKTGPNAALSGFLELADIPNPGDNTMSAMVYQIVSPGTYVAGGVNSAGFVTGSVAAAVAYKFAPPPPLDFNLRLTGGASNPTPANSHGGVESSIAAPANLFDTEPYLQAQSGFTDYRCITIHNNDTQPATVKAWVSSQFTTAGMSIAIGPASEAAGSIISATPNLTTPPTGVSFSSPSTEGTAINLGTVGPGQGKGVWVRRITGSGTAPDPTNPYQLSFKTTPV